MCVFLVVSLFFRRLFLGIGRRVEGLTGFDDNPYNAIVLLYKHAWKTQDSRVFNVLPSLALENF